MHFTDLGLAEPLLRAVREQGYDTPTPIQAQAIPVVLKGGDLMGGAQTGTGKTAGFTLPMLQRLSLVKPARDARGRIAIRALILTPTRELAAQVEESVRTYGKYLPLTSMVMFGGVGMQPQIDRLRKGVDILVATPGRLLDHHQQGTLDLSHVEIFVLDEADRMLDMGFIHDIKKVLAVLPAKKQSLLFSATFSDEIKALADRLLNAAGADRGGAPQRHRRDLIAQKVHPVGRERKKELLAHLIKTGDWHQVLVFTRMKHGANRLTDYLNDHGITRDGDPRQQEPGRAHQGAGRLQGRRPAGAGGHRHRRARHRHRHAAARRELRAAQRARGLRAPHRPHRPRRRQRRGDLAGLPGRGDLPASDIERLIKRSIPREVVPGFEPPAGERAEPIVLGRMTIGVGGTRRNAGGGGGGYGGGGGGRGGRPGGGGGGGGRPAGQAPARPGASRPAAGGSRSGGGGGGGYGGARPAASRGGPPKR